MKNLVKPENEAEAIALQAILKQHDIQAEVFSFHDTAYDGLFQSQYGWGVIKVEEVDYSQALRIVTEWKESPPNEVQWEEDSS
jgi:hypothetical protein